MRKILFICWDEKLDKKSDNLFSTTKQNKPCSKFMITAESQHHENKIVMVGDMGVGKTTIIQRFMTGDFDSKITPTIGAASQQAAVTLKSGNTVNLTIWDTAGQERYQSLIPLYLRNAKGIFFVCDVTATNTIQTLNAIYTSLSDVDPHTFIYLVGNKIDLESTPKNENDYPELHQWATEHHMLFRVVSAKTGVGIEDLFCSLATSILEADIDTLTTNENHVRQSKNFMCC